MAETTLHLHDEDLAASICWRLLLLGSDKAKIDSVTSPCPDRYDVTYRYWSDDVKDEVYDMIDEWHENAAAAIERGLEGVPVEPDRRGTKRSISRTDVMAVRAVCTALDAESDPDVDGTLASRIFEMCSTLIDCLQDEGLAEVTLEWIETVMEIGGDAE